MKKVLLAVSVAVLCGCTWNMPHQIASSNTPVKPNGYKIVGPASGKSCETHLFGLFRIGRGMRIQRAIDNALKKSGGDAMIEITTDVTISHFLITNRSCVLVNGLAIKK